MFDLDLGEEGEGEQLKKSGTATLVGAKMKKPLSSGPSDLGFPLLIDRKVL